MNMEKIGFIGTGIMGKPMAKNLMDSGYQLNIFARHPEKVIDLQDKGASLFENIDGMAAESTVIITMLPDSPDSLEVITGEGGVASSAGEGTLVIDMSSIDPIISMEIGSTLKKQNIAFIDAPVSGGEEGAIKGELAIMAGGSESDFKRAEPLFKIMGKSHTLTGKTGAGNFTKLANQIIVALNIAAMGEAFVLAGKAGISLETVYKAIKGGLAGSNVLDSKAPRIFSGDYEPGFKIGLHHKDIKNALSAADSLGVPLPLTSFISEVLKSLKTAGYSGSDHAAIIKFFEKISGDNIR
jgi:2-hydroxy-3-oxopropionate reductase